MSTTVTYKGSTLTTAENQTRTLKTSGKYLEDDITIVDVTSGGGQPSLQTKTKTYTPTESQQTETVTADSGYDGLEEVDVTVNAISPTYVGSGIARKSSTDLTVSGATVTAPAGYYASSASKAVSSGTAGTPTATKGTVSNHSVSVTPSVTNTTGYITGSTKTGTAVTVSASELVSGSQTITDNANNVDVTNLASVNVSIPFSTIRTGSTEPSSSLGVNGDVYMQTGGGGGGSVTVEALSVTSNGTYTAPAGTAYSPVSVNVEPTLNPLSVTSNGTYTPTSGTGYGVVTVNVTPSTARIPVRLNRTSSAYAQNATFLAYATNSSTETIMSSWYFSALNSSSTTVYLPASPSGKGFLFAATHPTTNQTFIVNYTIVSGGATNLGPSGSPLLECEPNSAITLNVENN